MAAIDLTTVANVQEWMPAPSATPSSTTLATQKAILQAAITAVSLDFMRRTGCGSQNGSVPSQSPFVQPVQYSDVYDGNGNDRQFVRNWPIVSVQSLTANGIAISASSGYPNAGYQIDGSGKSIVLIGGVAVPFCGLLRGSRGFPRGRQNIAIAYTAGYATVAVSNELQTIPSSSPYTVIPGQPWISDGGVKYFSNGTAFTAVQTAPAQGQYYLNNGVYLFAAADAGQQIQISYTAAGTPADIQNAVTRMIYLIYLRRSWEGLRSLAKPESGQTNYSAWEVDPSAQEVIDNYTRRAIV